MKLLLIIPAFNEAQVIQATLRSIKGKTKRLKPDLIVIDDGSRDQTAVEASHAGVKVLRHAINRGLGGAIGTGLEYAKRAGYDIAVTIDADGQHNPEDIFKVIEPIQKNHADIVIGSRFSRQNEAMPKDRQVMLRLSNWLTFFMFGTRTSDSLSGFRAFNRTAIENVQIKTDRMEVSNEIFGEIKRLNLKLTEVPIQVIYTPYSRAKGQSNSNAVRVVYKLILRLFR